MINKSAFITGGSRGIGNKIAEKLADEGWNVAVTGTKTDEQAKEAVKNIKNVFYIQSDISDTDSSRLAAQKVCERFGGIDLLVNNAGVAPKSRGDLLSMDEESYDFVVNTNLRGTFFMTQTVANIMSAQIKKEQQRIPRIINISSISAYTSSVARGQYCISKAGISMVTLLFADRLAKEGIPVFEIRPGIIKTDMTGPVAEKYEGLIKDGLTPIKRWGLPSDIAGIVSALCTGAFDFCTGQVINADGGFHIRRL